MSCNRCGSNDLWDDNLWWGCNSCGYAAGPDGGTMIFAKDKPGLARNLRDIPGANDRPLYGLVVPVRSMRDDEGEDE